MTYQAHKFRWHGIDIEARYEVESCCSDYSHLEIISINPPCAPLPMTETGYRSHFHPKGMIEQGYGGDVVACVLSWLNEEAKSKKWKNYIEESKQLALF